MYIFVLYDMEIKFDMISGMVNINEAYFKGPLPITFSSPSAQPEVVHFLISNESPYFPGYKSKILALNSL